MLYNMKTRLINVVHRIRILVSLLIVISISLSCLTGCVNGSDFIIREGITFGDTKNTVIEKESLVAAGSLDGYNSIQYCGEVAGYSDSEVVYLFNDNNQLQEVLYRIRTTSADDIKKRYS